MVNKRKAVHIGLIYLVLGISIGCFGCCAPKPPSALETVKSQVEVATLVLRISEFNWRMPCLASGELLDEIIAPIKDDPKSLANLCIFVTDLLEREEGDSDHSYFLNSLKWRAAAAFCKTHSPNAYEEFKKLKPVIGPDGGESLIFEELVRKYFPDRMNDVIR